MANVKETAQYKEKMEQLERRERMRTDWLLIVDITKRAENLGLLQSDRISLIMDLHAYHDLEGLQLDKLLNADDSNFTHDIMGMQCNIDRTDGTLNEYFSPRYVMTKNN